MADTRQLLSVTGTCAADSETIEFLDLLVARISSDLREFTLSIKPKSISVSITARVSKIGALCERLRLPVALELDMLRDAAEKLDAPLALKPKDAHAETLAEWAWHELFDHLGKSELRSPSDERVPFRAYVSSDYAEQLEDSGHYLGHAIICYGSLVLSDGPLRDYTKPTRRKMTVYPSRQLALQAAGDEAAKRKLNVSVG